MAEKREFKKRREWVPTEDVQDDRHRAITQRLDKVIELLEKTLAREAGQGQS